MCGWAGFFKPAGLSSHEGTFTVRQMATTLAHRGPDDEGIWDDPQTGIALGFRRLAIVDLSAEGHQPMHSASGRYVMLFNGEVYNFAELRAELEALGHSFRGHSDTEVMLAAIEQWGVERAVQRFVGMFAIALWDRSERALTLLRDRLGIKPLYYGWMGGTLLFGSELKALRAHPAFQMDVNRDALTSYLRYGYVLSPATIYRGINQLRPGSLVTFSASERDAQPRAFWSAAQVAARGAADPFRGSDAEAIEQLDVLLREAVRLRMIADVPLGAFLSGGVDSSSVVALMQAQSAHPVKTFSIGFHEAEYDEAQYARAVAAHLGTDHTELYLSAAHAQAVIPRLPTMYDEPFADPSQIPTFLVSELTRRHVTVSLSGDGGDELFAGYERYFRAERTWQRLGWIPHQLRAVLGGSAAALQSQSRLRAPALGSRRLAQMRAIGTPDQVYHYVRSQWKDPAAVVIGGHEQESVRGASLPDFFARMMLHDTLTYLPDDILTKLDRASMAVSLEARVPLLDHRVVEFAWQLPLALKVRNGERKWILRQVLNRYVPRQLIDRPKMGFAVPLNQWLRGPLRAWGEALIDARRLRDEGFFHAAPIRAAWDEHQSGKRDNSFYLWDVLMFQAWFEHWGAAPALGHGVVQEVAGIA